MRFLLAVLGLFGFNLALASSQTLHLVHSREIGLTLVSLKIERETSAKFSGQAWVTGTLVGRWSAGAANMTEKAPEYLLVPDRASAAKLPYFVLRDPPYFNRYQVKTIDVQNGEEALRMASSAKAVDSLIRRKVDAVRATGAFLIEKYSVGVECNYPWASAVVVKAKMPSQVVQDRHAIPEGC